MKAIMVMYDTLCRHFLQPYGNDWVKTPNFKRLAEHSVTFENNYVNSLPCMPARRDLHNSRLNFLQRDWGPIEPYDDSMPEILRMNGVYSALVSDHYHYWEDGGSTYHTRYSSWIASRGQEGDACIGDKTVVDYCNKLGKDVADPQKRGQVLRVQDQVNRSYRTSEDAMPQAQTFAEGLSFIDRNHDAQSWFLQIEAFDPHEPFFTQPQWKELYPELAEYVGKETDWPGYDPVREHETKEDIEYVRRLYAALVSMCDHYLGKVLDKMDEYNLWEDTMLIVNTDHGFLLGEHDWWGKSIMPPYEEISHTPLFIYDPVSKIQGERRDALSCPIDLPVTLLDYFGIDVPKDMQGHSLLPVIRENKKVRGSVLFGFHACHVAVTDGDYVYFRAPRAAQEQNCYNYTLMPTHMAQRFFVEELRQAVLVDPLPNSKGCPVLKIPAWGNYVSSVNYGTKLFCVKDDPRQKSPLDDARTEARLANLMVEEMKKADAPAEQYERLGLLPEGGMTAEYILASREQEDEAQTPPVLADAVWTQEAKNAYRAFVKMMPKEAVDAIRQTLPAVRKGRETEPVSYEDIVAVLKRMLPPEQRDQLLYFLPTATRAE